MSSVGRIAARRFELAADAPRQGATRELLLRGKEEWEATVDSLSDLVILTTADGRISRCNEASCRAVGASFQDVVGRHVDDLFWSLEGGPRLTGVEEGVTEVGVLGRSFRVSRCPVRRRSDAAGWVYVIRDETGEREARERVARERERFAAVLWSMGDAVFVVDSEDRIVLMNRAAEALTGRRLDDSAGLPLADVYETTVLASGREPRSVADAADGHGALRDRLFRAPGRAPQQVVECRSEFPDVDGRPGRVIVVRNVTSMRRLQAIAASVDLSNNLGHLVAGVRHELGNPLNALKTALTILRETFGAVSPERSLALVDRALRDAGRLEALLERLRKLALFDEVKAGECDVTELLGRLDADLRDTLGRDGVDLALRAPEAPVLAWADLDALEQAAVAVVVNAAEATVGQPSRKVEVELVPEGSSVRLRVLDSGPGFGPEALEQAFIPLYTTKPNGTGLGLPIARQLLSHMGATLSVRNGTEGGALVEMALSRRPPPRD